VVTEAQAGARTEAREAPKAPGWVLGLGLGGFVDGIVLHQILQWHHMLTGMRGSPAITVAGLETNTLADVAFLVLGALLVAGGLALARRPRARAG